MIDFQLITAPFRFGVDEGTDPKQVPFGTLTRAENVVWKKSGRLEKRAGLTAVDMTSDFAINSAVRFVTRGEQLGLINNEGALYVYDSHGGEWLNHGVVAEVGIEWKTLHESVRGLRCLDAVQLDNGHIVLAWADGDATSKVFLGGLLKYQVIDPDSGSSVVNPVSQEGFDSTGFGGMLRLLKSGNNWGILFYDESGRIKSVMSISGVVTETILQTDGQSSARLALDAMMLNSDFVVAYLLSAGGIKLRRYTFVATPVEVTSVTVAGEASTQVNSISLAGSEATTIFILYGTSTPTGGADYVKYATASPSTLAQVVAPTTLATLTDAFNTTVGCLADSATTAIAAWSTDSDEYPGGVLVTEYINTSGVVTTGNRTAYLRLVSRPFTLGGRFYLVASNSNWANEFSGSGYAIFGSDSFLLDAYPENDASFQYPSRLVGKLSFFDGGNWMGGFVTSAIAISAEQVRVAVPYTATSATAAPGAFLVGAREGARFFSFTIGSSRPEDFWRGITYGQETYLSAGYEVAYDGLEPACYGWPYGPYLSPGATFADSHASAEMQTGNYIYSMTGERRSNVGVLHRSPVATTLTVAVTGPTGRVNLKFHPVGLAFSRYSECLLPVYRTVVNGTIPQRLTIEPRYNSPFNNDNLHTFPSGIVDTSDDADISNTNHPLSARPFMYTQGGELEDVSPPALVTHCIYRDRIFAIDGSRSAVIYTKSFVENPGTAGGFNPAFRIPFNDTLTGLAVLDERLIIFSATGIYTLAGNGPAPNGDDSDYGSPNRVQTDVGCVNARGIVTGPDGVFFIAGGITTEIHLLDRGLNVVWIGKPVQDLLTAFPNVTSAVLLSDKNQVRFSCNNAAGSAGIVIVYDYQEKQWSHFTYLGGVAIADAVLFNGTYLIVRTNGAVYEESEATNLDAGAWVTARLETAWVHASGPLNYQSVRNFQIDGTSVTAHGLSIYAAFNGESTYQQGPETWAEGVSGVTSPGLQKAKLSIGTRRKCSSIRFKIEDSAPVTLGAGTGAQWSSMGIEVGIKRGPVRLATRQTG